jgi:hypothetical protein
MAYGLQVLTLRDDSGAEKTLRVTSEHPFHIENTGWAPARTLAKSNHVLGAQGRLTVTSNLYQPHPKGIEVFNLEVEQAHTYFVLAEQSADDGGAVWVHNADYSKRGPKTDNRFGHNRAIREQARAAEARGDTVLAGGRSFDRKKRAEAVIPTSGGVKSKRRPDLLLRRSDGSIYAVNVGRVDAYGRPVKREREAIQDLNEIAGYEVLFVPYGKPGDR